MSKFGILYECSMYEPKKLHKKEIQQMSDDKDSLVEWVRNKGKSIEDRVPLKWTENGFSFVDSMGTFVAYTILRFAERSDVIETLRDQLLKSSNEELEYLYSRYSKERIKIE